MYDALTASYRFSCPERDGTVAVRLSAFRTVDRLPGPSHPAVYTVTFSCPCGEVHEGLVPHDDLDLAPLAPVEAPFFNVMTGKLEETGSELADQAVGHLRRGAWPWCFFCRSEQRVQPVFPSAFRAVVPGEGSSRVLAAHCPGCGRLSANIVSPHHLDVPFYSDREVGVIERWFPASMAPDDLHGVLLEAVRDATPRRLAA